MEPPANPARFNRTIKDATVKRCHYDSHDQLSRHLDDFVSAYNFGRRLKTLKGLTPYEFICKTWTNQPERFKLNPLREMPGLNTSHVRLFKLQASDSYDRLRSVQRSRG